MHPVVGSRSYCRLPVAYCRLPIAGSQRFKGTKAESGPLPLAIYIQFFNAGPDSDEEFHLNGMFNDMWAA